VVIFVYFCVSAVAKGRDGDEGGTAAFYHHRPDKQTECFSGAEHAIQGSDKTDAIISALPIAQMIKAQMPDSTSKYR